VIATTVGSDERSVVLALLKASLLDSTPVNAWLCVSVSPIGPSGFQRHDRAGRYIADRRLTYQRYLPGERRVEINASWGPVFSTAPGHFGEYGNKSARDPNHYLDNNPYPGSDQQWPLNGQSVGTELGVAPEAGAAGTASVVNFTAMPADARAALFKIGVDTIQKLGEAKPDEIAAILTHSGVKGLNTGGIGEFIGKASTLRHLSCEE
jgi:hypothetical protein